jgi:hypothetical protein
MNFLATICIIELLVIIGLVHYYQKKLEKERNQFASYFRQFDKKHS